MYFFLLQRYRPAQAEFDPTDSLTIDLLKEYKVDLGDVLIKHPDLFQQSGQQSHDSHHL